MAAARWWTAVGTAEAAGLAVRALAEKVAALTAAPALVAKALTVAPAAAAKVAVGTVVVEVAVGAAPAIVRPLVVGGALVRAAGAPAQTYLYVKRRVGPQEYARDTGWMEVAAEPVGEHS